MKKNEKGLTLIEVIIAVALLGIIVVAFFGALSTASKALFIADEQATAESLARSQMEYVKSQSYREAPLGGQAIYTKLLQIPGGYTIWSVNRDGETEDIVGVPWDPEGNHSVAEGVGLQKIRLVIKHHGKEVIKLEDYKVDL